MPLYDASRDQHHKTGANQSASIDAVLSGPGISKGLSYSASVSLKRDDGTFQAVAGGNGDTTAVDLAGLDVSDAVCSAGDNVAIEGQYLEYVDLGQIVSAPGVDVYRSVDEMINEEGLDNGQLYTLTDTQTLTIAPVL